MYSKINGFPSQCQVQGDRIDRAAISGFCQNLPFGFILQFELQFALPDPFRVLFVLSMHFTGGMCLVRTTDRVDRILGIVNPPPRAARLTMAMHPQAILLGDYYYEM